jgi:predicted lipoprotein with Yx(FWY)xxD motif
MNYLVKAALAAGLVCPIALSSCSKSNNYSAPPSPPANTVRITNNTTFGNVLTDSAGNTLYFFSPDANGQTACTGPCLAAWPSFYTPKVTADAGLQASDFGFIKRPDGGLQSTYKGWPLYYFAQDTKAGQVNGDGLESVWFVAKPDYSVMLAVGALKGADSLSYDSLGHSSATPVATEYFTDDKGVTLYTFSHDTAGANLFTKSDFSNNSVWPIYQVSAVGKIPSILKASDFSVITVFGKTQLTYKGWPLYNFGGDGGVRGNTAGVSVPTAGAAIWPVARQFANPAP